MNIPLNEMRLLQQSIKSANTTMSMKEIIVCVCEKIYMFQLVTQLVAHKLVIKSSSFACE